MEMKVHWLVRMYDKCIDREYYGLYDLICSELEAQEASLTFHFILKKWDARDNTWYQIGNDYNITIKEFEDIREVIQALNDLELAASHCSFIHEHL